jgi:hypothetical protein
MVCTNFSGIIQKRINGQVMQFSSMNTLKLNTCARTINNANEGKKHSSYARVLQRRRACAF